MKVILAKYVCLFLAVAMVMVALNAYLEWGFFNGHDTNVAICVYIVSIAIGRLIAPILGQPWIGYRPENSNQKTDKGF